MPGTDEPRPENEASHTDVLVLGASFAGIELVYQLARRADRAPLEVVVVDRQREHGYLPLVQERLCGRMDPASSRLGTAAYVESVPRASFVQDEVAAFDPETKTATLASGRRLSARFVVVALGSVVDPPPVIEGAEHLVAYKDAAQFARARARLEAVLGGTGDDPAVVVVGGGVSGVELAGELADLRRRRPDGWRAPRVTLVSADDRLIPGFGSRIARRVHRALEAQGVDLRLGTRLTGAHEAGVTVEDDQGSMEIPADLALWSGGIRPAPILADLGLPRTEEGWLKVGPTLQCFVEPEPTAPDVFACGDAVRIVGGDGEWPTMQRAIECIWQAKVVARNLVTLAGAEPTYPDGVPPLQPHELRETFFYGVSAGRTSLIVWHDLMLDLPGVNHWFRRWLMRQYFERYAPLPTTG